MSVTRVPQFPEQVIKRTPALARQDLQVYSIAQVDSSIDSINLTPYATNTTVEAISAGLNTRLTSNESLDTTQTNSLNTLFSTYANSTTVAAISAGLNTTNTTQTNSLNTLFSTYANSTTVAAISAGLNTTNTTQTNSINTLFSTYANSTTVAAISAGLDTRIDSLEASTIAISAGFTDLGTAAFKNSADYYEVSSIPLDGGIPAAVQVEYSSTIRNIELQPRNPSGDAFQTLVDDGFTYELYVKTPVGKSAEWYVNNTLIQTLVADTYYILSVDFYASSATVHNTYFVATATSGQLVNSQDPRLSRYVGVPASATTRGKAGDYAIDASYLYVCHTANTWRRISSSSW
jgi:hypothetical protein